MQTTYAILDVGFPSERHVAQIEELDVTVVIARAHEAIMRVVGMACLKEKAHSAIHKPVNDLANEYVPKQVAQASRFVSFSAGSMIATGDSF